jgi:glycerophosphoryl diester phosphodiesterase
MVSTPDGFLPLRGFRACLKQSLVFHVVMQAFAFALYTPLASLIAQRVVRMSGESVVSNFDLVHYALSPAGLLFLLIVVSIAVSVLLAEFTGQTWIAGHAIAGRRVTTLSAVALVLRRLPALLRLGGRIFLRLALVALPFLLAGALLWRAKLGGHDINYYLAERPPEWRHSLWIGGALALGLFALASQQLARWLFAIPLIVFEHMSPWKALLESARMTKGHRLAIALRIAAWWAPMVAFAALCALVGRRMSDALLEWAGMDFGRVLPLIMLFAAVTTAFSLAWSGIALGGHQFIVTRLFTALVGTEGRGQDWLASRLEVPADPDVQRSRRHALPVVVGLMALLPVGLIVGHRIAAGLVDHGAVAVTAHRGASVGAPENTMAAFDAAIAAGADFIELDVQRASDGGVVVVHDGDLMRLAGNPHRIGELSVAELAAVDVGRHFDAAFAGQTVPTLEQVIDRARGQLKINVELKYNVPDPQLAPAVVDLLRRKDFIDQVVITSLDSAALAQIRGIEPGLKTGRIVTAAVGDIADIPADFASLNAARATPVLVRHLHARGKQVHVWTVNTPDAILVMMERGVDNLITDDPALARRVISERAALGTSERLALRLRVLFDRPPREVTHSEAVKPL